MLTNLRSRIILTIAVIIALTIGTASAAELQYQGPVTLEGTEQFTLTAQAIDQVFRIDVALPSSYGQTDQNYPVVYMMDSNLMFTGVMNGAWGLQFGQEVPEVIIIGIGYAVENLLEVITLRNRDLLPTNDPEFEAQNGMPDDLSTGGAEAFLAFINEEVKPAMNARYRINTDSQSLVGYSFGGEFSLFTLFTHPDAFDNYVIGSPSIWWHDTVIFDYETRYADAHDDLPKNVYISSGALEEAPDGDDFMMVSNARKMTELLQSRNYPNLKVSYKNFADDTHATSYLPSAIQGLRFVLGD